MSIESRRKLLKSIAAGSGAIVAGKSLPESWSRPVVDSVMIPAHAETSPPALVNSSGPAGRPSITKLDDGSFFADVADTLIPEANAGVEFEIIETQVCVTQTSDTTGNFEAWIVYQDECDTWTIYYSAQNVTKGDPATLTIDDQCGVLGDASDVLKKLGLVNDAMAAIDHMVTIETFAGSLGGAEGEFEDIDSSLFPFNLGEGGCDRFNIQCDQDAC